MAESIGFEPMLLSQYGFQDRCLQPLGQLSLEPHSRIELLQMLYKSIPHPSGSMWLAGVTRIELAVAGLESAGLPLTDTPMVPPTGIEPVTPGSSDPRSTV